MDKTFLIKEISHLLINGNKQSCYSLAEEYYPFSSISPLKRQYSRYKMCKVFLRDGFIDRYSGAQLLFPGLIRILTIEFPEIFRYNKNWKMSETHIIYWELFPTIDHLVPIARGGNDIEDNWVTTSMVHNSAKANWTLEELGWTLHDKGDLTEWDGLISTFLELIRKSPDYEKDNYINSWKHALVKVIK